MNYRDTENLVIEAVTQYYQGNLQLFHELLHPEAVLLSVGRGQMFMGKESIQTNLYDGNAAGIRYDIKESSCKVERVERRICYTILDTDMMTYYPNDTAERVNQRFTVLWKYIPKNAAEKEGVVKDGWYAMHIHISIAKETQKPPINSAHLSENVLEEMLAASQKEERIALQDVKGCMHYLPQSQIIRFESADHQTMVYLQRGEVLLLTKKMSQLEKDLADRFIRIHRRHIVNAQYVKQAKNYKLTLEDGTELPIPKEGFARIKKQVAELVQ